MIKAHEYVGWTQKITLLPKLLQIGILGITVWCRLTLEWYYALTAFSMFLVIPFAVHKIKGIAPYVSFTPFLDKSIFKTILPYCLNIFSFGLFSFSINYLRSCIFRHAREYRKCGRLPYLKWCHYRCIDVRWGFYGRNPPVRFESSSFRRQGSPRPDSL